MKQNMTPLEHANMLNATLESALDHQVQRTRVWRLRALSLALAAAGLSTLLLALIVYVAQPSWPVGHWLAAGVSFLLHPGRIHWTLLGLFALVWLALTIIPRRQ